MIPALLPIIEGPPTYLADAVLYALAEVGDASVLPTIERILARCARREYGSFMPNVRLAAEQAARAIEGRLRRRRAKPPYLRLV